MSFLVLHMNKFGKQAIRGIQSHNMRERKSNSNPDIEYERSAANYELHDGASTNYAEAIQNRIDDLLLTKAVRKDAVHLCGVIVSSDSAFFKDLSPKETRRFFEVCKERMTEFVGKENVISAMVHMDEKTPHMHFLHVPVTKDGRLNANAIYTRESLKFLQDYMPQHLKSKGFDIQRGVAQEPGSKKIHLSTQEYKQQQNALNSLRKDVQAVKAKLEKGKQLESDLQKRVQSYEQQAQEAEKVLETQHSIPDASVFNFKSVLEQAKLIINMQKRTLAGKEILDRQNEWLQRDVRELSEKNVRLEAEIAIDKKRSSEAINHLHVSYNKLRAQIEETEKFFRHHPEINSKHIDFLQQERRETARKAAEQKAREREQQQREERERQAQEQERQKAQELERQREEERRRSRESERARRGMGMGR